MSKFDPASMPDTTSPTVRALRAFVEKTIEDEVDSVAQKFDETTTNTVEKSLRSVVFSIFHNNPDVHKVANGDMYAFDSSIRNLFNIGTEFTNDTEAS